MRRHPRTFFIGLFSAAGSIALLAFAIILAAPPAVALAPPVGGASSLSKDADAIREVIQSAYIAGLHRNGSREDIRAGFHPSFVMSILREDGNVAKLDIEQWIGGLPAPGEAPEATVTAEIPHVTVVGDTGTAQVEVYRDGAHVFTDFMGLYRFPEGWRIVNKIFQRHE